MLGMSFPSSFHAVGLSWFHNFLNSWLFGVLIFVFVIFCFLSFELLSFKILGMSYSKAESFCALIPTLIIFVQMLPSMYFLYMMTALDTTSDLSIKVVGHQWYWHYEYMDFSDLEYDSFMKSTDDLLLGDQRIMDVDSRLFLPLLINTRVCFSGADVIHSWALPSAGIKVDCSPGLLNCLTVNFPLVGVFYGQCSEICGSNHSFMPVVLEVTSWDQFFFFFCLTIIFIFWNISFTKKSFFSFFNFLVYLFGVGLLLSYDSLLSSLFFLFMVLFTIIKYLFIMPFWVYYFLIMLFLSGILLILVFFSALSKPYLMCYNTSIFLLLVFFLSGFFFIFLFKDFWLFFSFFNFVMYLFLMFMMFFFLFLSYFFINMGGAMRLF